MNLGLIGTGRWGTNILKTLQAFSDCQVETATTDYKNLLAKKLDAVLIATPGSTHAEIARPFLEAGIATFIEKPLTMSYADAVELEKIAKKSGAIGMTGHVHVYNPAFLKLKELAGKSGKIRQLFFEGTNNGPYRDDMSALWDWAPHDIVMALDLLEEVPSSVQAWGIKALRPDTALYDTATIKLTFASGVTALCLVSWLMPEKRKKVTVIAEKNSVVLDDTAQKKVILYENMGPYVSNGVVTRQESIISYPEYSSDPSLKLELQAFIEAVKTKQQPRASLAQGVQVVKIIEAAQRSIQLEGQPVEC